MICRINNSFCGYSYWRADTPIPSSLRDKINAFESWGPNRRFGVVALTKPHVFWFGVQKQPPRYVVSSHFAFSIIIEVLSADDRVQAVGSKKDQLLKMFNGWHHPITDVIQHTPESSIAQTDIYDMVLLRSWHRHGRVTLLGDSCHATTPNLAQGRSIHLITIAYH
jgi:2-polyprenyl-6-methoxyphenol hydroxylase-like FAD-dependent oxidoreductase